MGNSMESEPFVTSVVTRYLYVVSDYVTFKDLLYSAAVLTLNMFYYI